MNRTSSLVWAGRSHLSVLLCAGLLSLALTPATPAKAAPAPSSSPKQSSTTKSAAAKSPSASPRPSPSPLRSQNRKRIGAMEGASRPPSPELAVRIQQAESGLSMGSVAVGLAGGALLHSMLSSNDLSSSDRSWINARLAELARQEELQEPALLGRATATVAFKIIGLKPWFEPGEEVTLSISAERAGMAVAVICSVPGARAESAGKIAQVRWRPPSPGVDLLTCEAEGFETRRLLRVALGE